MRDLPSCEVPEEGELEHMKAFSPGLLFALMTVIEICSIPIVKLFSFIEILILFTDSTSWFWRRCRSSQAIWSGEVSQRHLISISSKQTSRWHTNQFNFKDQSNLICSCKPLIFCLTSSSSSEKNQLSDIITLNVKYY